MERSRDGPSQPWENIHNWGQRSKGTFPQDSFFLKLVNGSDRTRIQLSSQPILLSPGPADTYQPLLRASLHRGEKRALCAFGYSIPSLNLEQSPQAWAIFLHTSRKQHI